MRLKLKVYEGMVWEEVIITAKGDEFLRPMNPIDVASLL